VSNKKFQTKLEKKKLSKAKVFSHALAELLKKDE
jgi:hypothetical protein